MNRNGEEGIEREPDTGRLPPEGSIIWTRRNKLLFVVVVVLGALILAQLCFVALLIASPILRERVFHGADAGGIVVIGELCSATVKILEHFLG